MEHLDSLSNQVHVTSSDVLKSEALSNVCCYTNGALNIKLSSCIHITSLCLIMTSHVNKPRFNFIADHVELTTTIKESRLQELSCERLLRKKKHFPCWSIFTTSLTRNSSI